MPTSCTESCRLEEAHLMCTVSHRLDVWRRGKCVLTSCTHCHACRLDEEEEGTWCMEVEGELEGEGAPPCPATGQQEGEAEGGLPCPGKGGGAGAAKALSGWL